MLPQAATIIAVPYGEGVSAPRRTDGRGRATGRGGEGCVLPSMVRCGWVQTSPVIAPAARCHPLRLRRGQGIICSGRPEADWVQTVRLHSRRNGGATGRWSLVPCSFLVPFSSLSFFKCKHSVNLSILLHVLRTKTASRALLWEDFFPVTAIIGHICGDGRAVRTDFFRKEFFFEPITFTKTTAVLHLFCANTQRTGGGGKMRLPVCPAHRGKTAAPIRYSRADHSA